MSRIQCSDTEHETVSRVADFNLADQARPGRPPEYPWKLWFDGRTHILTRGEDFDTEPKAFRSTVYSASKRYGVPVTTKVAGEDELHVQALTPMSANGQAPRRRRVVRRARR